MAWGKHRWRQRVTGLRREALAGNVVAVAELGALLNQGIQDERGRAVVVTSLFMSLLRPAAAREGRR